MALIRLLVLDTSPYVLFMVQKQSASILVPEGEAVAPQRIKQQLAAEIRLVTNFQLYLPWKGCGSEDTECNIPSLCGKIHSY